MNSKLRETEGYVESKVEYCSNGKVMYDKRGAQTARNRRLKREPYLRIYQCEHGNHWHLTHNRVFKGKRKDQYGV